MTSVVLVLITIAAVLAIASGIWVAAALLRTLTSNKTNPDPNPPTKARP